MYGVGKSERFTKQLEELQNIEKIEEALTGIVWAVQSNPESHRSASTGIRYCDTKAWGAMPEIFVFFRIDSAAHQVVLEGIVKV